MDLHKVTERERSRRTEIVLNNQFAFDSSYSTQGVSLREELVQIKTFSSFQPSEITFESDLSVNIVFPVKEIVY